VLLEKLAMGGMAEVFLGRALGAGGISKFFAIKRILPQYADSPEFIDMFREEAKIAINLKHSNIVSIHEFGVQENQFFLVMDFVEGRNLRQILNKMKKSKVQFSTEYIVYLIREIASGLDHAHRCIDSSTGRPLNITHRDMSPQNVMVSFDGEVKIVDFGIAKAESQVENTRAGTLKGKFGYMSPEQAEGLTVDLRTDLFSLGIVMWELLANDRLFSANNEINTLRKIRDCHIPSLRKINPNIHSDLEKIVLKALARDKNLRYQSAAALHKDLNRFLNRQYPDFSSHDFAAYIKSVFADEILESRKKLVQYAKTSETSIAINNKNQAIDDKTMVSITREELTSSFLPTVTHTDTSQIQAIAPEGLDLSKNFTLTSTPNHSNTEGSDINEFNNPKNSETDPDKTVVTSNELDPSSLSSFAEDFPSNKKQSDPSDDNQVLDVTNRHQQPFSHEEVVYTDSPRSWDQNNRETHATIPVRVNSRNIPVAQFFLLAVVLLAAYLGAARMFPKEMAPLIAKTQPILGPIYDKMGMSGEVQMSSRSPQKELASENLPRQKPTNQNTESTNDFGQKTPHGYIEKSFTVSSNPSGAEILIDGEKTGLITPSRITVRKQNFTLELRRRDFEGIQQNLSIAEFGHSLNFNLKKLQLAYISVNVRPPQKVVFFVDDHRVDEAKFNLRNYPIPSDKYVSIKVIAGDGKSVTKKVRLKENENQTLEFKLSAPRYRLPSGK